MIQLEDFFEYTGNSFILVFRNVSKNVILSGRENTRAIVKKNKLQKFDSKFVHKNVAL